MRGQGYDNGANMKIKNNDTQKKILDLNPGAFFVPCAAHSLNLVVNGAANVSNTTIDLFGILQAIYTSILFSSTYHWLILKKHTHIYNLTVKPLSKMGKQGESNKST
jgi:hypothetical protein